MMNLFYSDSILERDQLRVSILPICDTENILL